MTLPLLPARGVHLYGAASQTNVDLGDPIQNHDRDDARRVALVLSEVRHDGRVRVKETVTLASIHHRRPSREAL
jgi:hypothetical protein